MQKRQSQDRATSWTVALAPFVGRAVQVAQLEHSLREAGAAKPQVLLISGDAGVGKSRLLGELLQRANAEGARMLVGACHEDVTIPYLPMAVALGPLIESASPADRRALEALVDPAAATPHVEAGPARADLDGVRLRLYLGASRALLDGAGRQLTVLAVEDLHWADEPTMGMLGHLVAAVAQAGSFSGARVLIAVTFRPGRGTDATLRALARFRRETSVRELRLGGLDEVEANELLAGMTGARPSRGLLLAVMEATEGNPLMVRSLVTRLMAGGDLVDRGGELVTTAQTELVGLPADLDDELGTRVDGVTTECRRLLTLAAFLGDDERLADLRAVSGLEEPAFTGLLDEAETAGLVVDDGERFRFDHPQIRQILYHAPRGRERQRLHLGLADRLEANGGNPLVIAHHLAQATPSASAAGARAEPQERRARLARYARMAGDQAFAVGAWGLAARYYDLVLASGDGGPVTASVGRAEIHHRAATAHYRNHNNAACMANEADAIALARAAGDLRLWGAAALLSVRADLRVGAQAAGDLSPLDEFLRAAGDREPAMRARVHALRAEKYFDLFDMENARADAARARDLAGDLDDDELTAEIEFAVGLQHLGVLELAEAVAAFERSLDHARRLEDPWLQSWGAGRLPVARWAMGDLAEAATLGTEACRIGRTTSDWAEHALASACLAGVAAARGDFGAAERHGDESAAFYRRSDYSFAPLVAGLAQAQARATRGDAVGAHEAVEACEQLGIGPLPQFHHVVDAVVGDSQRLRRSLARDPWPTQTGVPPHLFLTPLVAAQAEVGDAIGDQDLLAAAAPDLEVAYERGVRFCPGWSFFVPRLLGVAALGCGGYDEAEHWLSIAAGDAVAASSDSETAHVAHDRARMLLARGREEDRDEVAVLLSAACRAFDELGMLPLVAASRRLARGAGVALHAGPDEAPPTLRVVLATDIIGSTALNQRLGDLRFVEVLRKHNRIIRARLREHDGVEVKHTGDGMCAWFGSASNAVFCALGIFDDFAEYSRNHPGEELAIRVGLAAGEPIGLDGDLFGLSVVTAFRICSLADGRGVLTAPEIPGLTRGTGLRFEPLGEFTLKGITEPVTVFAATAAAG